MFTCVVRLDRRADLLQGGDEVGVGDGSCFGSVDCGGAAGVEGSDRQTHGNPMIGITIDIGAS